MMGMAQHMQGPAHHAPPHMGPGVGQLPTVAMQQQLNGGNYYPHGNGALPPVGVGGAGGIPPQQGGLPPPQGPGGYGNMYPPPDVHTPSTHMTDLIMSPSGSQGSQFTGVISPGMGNGHHNGYSNDGSGVYALVLKLATILKLVFSIVKYSSLIVTPVQGVLIISQFKDTKTILKQMPLGTFLRCTTTSMLPLVSKSTIDSLRSIPSQSANLPSQLSLEKTLCVDKVSEPCVWRYSARPLSE